MIRRGVRSVTGWSTLRRQTITFIADNLSSHKVPPARQLIEKAGAELLFVPPYSPELNPVEMVFSIGTSFRKKGEKRKDRWPKTRAGFP